MTEGADAFAHLQRNVLVFGRTLRALGFRAQPDRMVLLAEALKRTGIERRVDVKAAARAVLVRNKEELARFEIAFDEFWRADGGLTAPAPPAGWPGRRASWAPWPARCIRGRGRCSS